MALPQHVNNVGRATTLTPKVHDAIVGAIRDGNYESVSYRSAGIKDRCFFSWKEKGKASIERGDNDCIYAQFMHDIDIAKAHAETGGVSELRHHGKRSYQATLEFLSRRYPSRWGKQDKVQIEANVNVNTVPMGDLTLETKQQILAELRAKTELTVAEPMAEIAVAVVDSDSDEVE